MDLEEEFDAAELLEMLSQDDDKDDCDTVISFTSLPTSLYEEDPADDLFLQHIEGSDSEDYDDSNSSTLKRQVMLLDKSNNLHKSLFLKEKAINKSQASTIQSLNTNLSMLRQKLEFTKSKFSTAEISSALAEELLAVPEDTLSLSDFVSLRVHLAMKSTKNELETMRTKYETLLANSNNNSKEKGNNDDSSLNIIKASNVELQNQLSLATESLTTVRTKAQHTEKSLREELETQKSQLHLQIASLNATIAEYKTSASLQKASYETLLLEKDEAVKEIAILQDSDNLMQLTQDLKCMTSKASHLESKLRLVEGENLKLKSQIENLTSARADVEAKFNLQSAELTDLKDCSQSREKELASKVAEALASVKIKTFEKNTIATLLEKANGTIETLNLEISMLRQKNSVLSNEYQSLSSTTSSEISVLLNEKNALSLKLDEYERLEKELDEAIETSGTSNDDEVIMYNSIPTRPTRRYLHQLELAKKVRDFDEKLRRVTSENQSLECENKTLLQRNKKMTDIISNLKQPTSYYVSKISSLEDIMDSLKADYEKLVTQVQDAKDIAASESRDKEALKAELENLISNRSEISALKSLVKDLQTSREKKKLDSPGNKTSTPVTLIHKSSSSPPKWVTRD